MSTANARQNTLIDRIKQQFGRVATKIARVSQGDGRNIRNFAQQMSELLSKIESHFNLFDVDKQLLLDVKRACSQIAELSRTAPAGQLVGSLKGAVLKLQGALI